jgi:hypothetical protein
MQAMSSRVEPEKGPLYASLSHYQVAAAGVLLLALLLTLFIPYDQHRLRMPEPWSYELAAANFAQGNWVLTTEELAAARTQIRLQGGQLTQYVEIAPEQWAFRQSPGHPLEMALFADAKELFGLDQYQLMTATAIVRFWALVMLAYYFLDQERAHYQQQTDQHLTTCDISLIGYIRNSGLAVSQPIYILNSPEKAFE